MKKYELSKEKLLAIGAAVSAFIYSAIAFFVPASNLIDAMMRFASDDRRLEIWRFGVSIASENFLSGFGPNGFSSYVSLLSPFKRSFNHVHSLPLDLWVSYGLVASSVLLLYVFAWIFYAIRSGILHDSAFSRAWFISFLLLIIFHVTDLPYLDARINLVGWILFTGIVSYAESPTLQSTKS